MTSAILDLPPGELYIRWPMIPPVTVPITAPSPNSVTAAVPSSTLSPFCTWR